jgi:hypothetical protein
MMTVIELKSFLEKLPDEMGIWIHYYDRYDDCSAIIALFESDLNISEEEYLLIDGTG